MSELRVEFGDCRRLLKELPKASIKLIVTSPPYNLEKKYGLYKDSVPLEQWTELIDEVLKDSHDVLSADGSFFLNLSPIPDKKTSEIIPLESIAWQLAKRHGYFLRNTIVWHFNNMQNCVNRLSGRWESVLWFVKDINKYTFNLDEVRIPVLTKNDKRFDASRGRNPTDVWYFDRVNNMTKKKYGITAPCVYPVPLIERIIKMASNEGDWILDPFLGSGTTLVACKKTNRNGVGFEIDSKYEKTIEKRLEIGQEALDNKTKLTFNVKSIAAQA
jgi:DNA modification methylase